MVKRSSDFKMYDEKIELVAQKYFNDFILGERGYRWDIGKEMKKAELGRNNYSAESAIMRRLDQLMKDRKDSQVV